MIQDFYITAKDIVDPKNKDFSVYSCELTAQLMEGATDLLSLIRNIENFNGDKPRGKRVDYALTVNGQCTPFCVAKARFLEGDDYIFVYVYNSNGSMYVTNDNDSIDIIDGITTYMIKVDQITAVNFGSFNKEDCGFLLNSSKDNTVTEDKITSLIENEIQSINSLISSGEYRSAINHFCIFMKNNNINGFDYNYNSKAYNRYIKLVGIYMNLIKSIVGRHDDPTINVNNPNVPNKMYFFKNKEKMEEFIKTAEHTRMHVTINNTFYDSDIEIYKQIISKE